MTDTIKVHTPAGYMLINPAEFFPNNVGNVRKLVKAIKATARYTQPDEGPATLLQLQSACREKLAEVEKCRKKYRALYEESINYKETSLYDGLYYSKRAIAVGYVLLQIDRDAKKLESNLDILEGADDGTD